MKCFSNLLFVCLLSLSVVTTDAQVTKLFNNNNIDFGAALGNIGVMVTATDSFWRTDGTPGGTFKYAANVSLDSPHAITLFAGKIYFTGGNAANGRELWVTDGTAGGTTIVKDIIPGTGSSSPDNFTVLNNTLYFVATTSANGRELWKSDGTTTGTTLLKDINPGAGSGITDNSEYTVINNNLYFSATNGISGIEPWISNGTEPGTILLKDINPGPGSSDPFGYTALGVNVFFSASEPTTGEELYKTNGTQPGTGIVMDIATGFFGSSPSQFMVFNNKLYFTALDFTNGFELWSTDGVTTALVKDIDPGFDSGFPFLFNAVFINNKFYFSASTATSGNELWVSDGTTAGTMLLKDINPGIESSSPFIMLDFYGAQNFDQAHSNLFAGKIFFEADNGTNGNELWITDGTLAGTVMVKDIYAGANSALDPSVSFDYLYTQNALFFTASDGSTGFELHRSTGSGPGTTRVFDLNPGMGNSLPSFVMILNNQIIFTANDGDNGNGLTDLYKLNEIVNPLPLHLLDFNASPSGKSVQVKWVTTDEINSSHFEVERSVDGVVFNRIGSVNALNSVQRNNYSYMDIDALLQGAEKIFYRLKMVYRDGKFTFSKIAVIKIATGNDLFYVYSNPVYDELKVMINSTKDQPAVLVISDAAGKHMLSRNTSNVRGINQVNFNVSAFPNGVYNIRLLTGEDPRTLQFVKK